MSSLFIDPFILDYVTYVYLAIGLGMLVGLLFSETLGVMGGGVIVPGYFALHLVDRDQFDPILEAANPLYILSPQKYAKKRITNSIVKFDNFDYKANFMFYLSLFLVWNHTPKAMSW